MHVVFAVVLTLLASLASAQDTRKQYSALPACISGSDIDGNPTVGTAEEVIATYTLPGNSLAVTNDGISFLFWGLAGDTSSKIVRARFGGLAGDILVAHTYATAVAWRVEGIILRTGAATQEAITSGLHAAGDYTVTRSTPAQTLSGNVDLVITVDDVDAGDTAWYGYRICPLKAN